jgi:hypothetical protein
LSDDFPTVIFNEIGNETKGNKVFVKLNFELSLPEQILSYLYQQTICLNIHPSRFMESNNG